MRSSDREGSPLREGPLSCTKLRDAGSKAGSRLKATSPKNSEAESRWLWRVSVTCPARESVKVAVSHGAVLVGVSPPRTVPNSKLACANAIGVYKTSASATATFTSIRRCTRVWGYAWLGMDSNIFQFILLSPALPFPSLVTFNFSQFVHELTPLRGCPRPEKMGCCRDDMPVKVKICGITNPPDGMAAAEAGADALGFVFYDQSPRHISVEAAAALIRSLPPFVMKVGVFVNAPGGTGPSRQPGVRSEPAAVPWR